MSEPQDVVSLHYFAGATDNAGTALLHASYLVVPGISESSSISPIVPDHVNLNEDLWDWMS